MITGKVQGGKTTLVSELLDRFKKENLKITGFLCPGTFKEGQRSSFTLMNLENGDYLPMATIEERKGWLKYRRFFFNPEAFAQGEVWIRNGLANHPDLVVIDEVGPMELHELGWWNTLKILEKQLDIAQIWIVREKILQEVIAKWNISRDNIFRVTEGENSMLVNRLYGKLKATIIKM